MLESCKVPYARVTLSSLTVAISRLQCDREYYVIIDETFKCRRAYNLIVHVFGSLTRTEFRNEIIAAYKRNVAENVYRTGL